MADHKCRQRRPVQAGVALPLQSAPMECAELPMNRYAGTCPTTSCACASCEPCCPAREQRILLEQLVELSVTQNQLLVDILGAVNALTAAMLTTRIS